MTNKDKLTLEQWRGLRRLSRRDLANLSNVTLKTITLYEKDIHKLRGGKYETVEKLANALRIAVSDIFLDLISEIPNNESLAKSEYELK